MVEKQAALIALEKDPPGRGAAHPAPRPAAPASRPTVYPSQAGRGPERHLEAIFPSLLPESESYSL